MNFFRRVEQKYLLSKDEYLTLTKLLSEKLEKDKYFYSDICSIYFDSSDNSIAINSMEKPLYKEKYRLRSYGAASCNDKVFLEVKKKFKDETSKRRVDILLKDFWRYYKKGLIPDYCDGSTMREIDFGFKKYKLIPKIFISYSRYSYCSKENKNLRITFDFNVRYRHKNLNLLSLDDTMPLLEDDLFIMEVKSLDGMPLWFTSLLNSLKIYPNGFSKYKAAYLKAAGNGR